MNKYPFSKKAIKAMLVASLVVSPFAGVGAVSAAEVNQVKAAATSEDAELVTNLVNLYNQLSNLSDKEKAELERVTGVNISEELANVSVSQLTDKFSTLSPAQKNVLTKVVEDVNKDTKTPLATKLVTTYLNLPKEDQKLLDEALEIKETPYSDAIELVAKLNEKYSTLSEDQKKQLEYLHKELKDENSGQWRSFVNKSITPEAKRNGFNVKATSELLKAFGDTAVASTQLNSDAVIAPNLTQINKLIEVYNKNKEAVFGEDSQKISRASLIAFFADFQEEFYNQLSSVPSTFPGETPDDVKDLKKQKEIAALRGSYSAYEKALTKTIDEIKVNGTPESKALVEALENFRANFKESNVVAANFMSMILNDSSGGGGGSFEDPIKEDPILKPFPFTDVPTTYWAYEYINTLYQKDIIEGMTATTFAPHKSVTRAEFATMLGRLLDLPAADTHGFTDVPAWAKNEVAELAQAGIVKGIGKGLFNSQAKISRQDMALMIVRAYEHTSGTTIETETNKVYNDQAKVKAYAKEAVQKLYELKVMEGRPNNLFAPQDASTRAEAAKVMALLLELTEDKEETETTTEQ